MISVLVDGKPFPGNISEVRTIANLIELIKLTIDPNSIITEMRLNGKFLDEVEWRASLVSLVGSTFEINTGSKNDYVHDRLTQAEELVRQIIVEFSDAGEKFRLGQAGPANQSFVGAVRDLNAFVSWYQTILSLAPEQLEKQVIEFTNHVHSIQSVCEQLLQQQLYQSWWALGETVKGRLEPQLQELRDFCQRSSHTTAQLG